METRTANRTSKTGETFFCIAYVIMLFRAILISSTASVYLATDSFFFRYLLRMIAYALILLKFTTQDAFTPKRLITYVFLCAYFALCVLFDKTLGLIDIAVLLVGAHGVSLKTCVLVFFRTTLSLTVLLFALSLFGVIENYTTYADDIPRYAFGSIYATDFAAKLFYLELSSAYLRKRKFGFIDLAAWCLVALLVYLFCRARLDTVLIFLFAALNFFLVRLPRLNGSGVNRAMIWLVPVCCVGSVLLHLFYTPDSALLSSLNGVLSGRLEIGNRVFEDYGFSLFGTQIEMQGWGFSTEVWNEALGYYFVDCGWLSVMLRFGILMPALICLSFAATMRADRKEGRGNGLSLILLFIAVTSIVDHHILEIGFNPFLFTIATMIGTLTDRPAVRGALAPQLQYGKEH